MFLAYESVILEQLNSILRMRLGPVPVGWWLLPALLALLVMFLCGLFFVRRIVVKHLLKHRINLSHEGFFGAAHSLADPLPVEGNRVDLLFNGSETFPVMLDAIRGARHSLNFEAFIFHSGVVGHAFQEAFKECAKAGVAVRLILDGVGSGRRLSGADVREMRDAGCQVTFFNPLLSWRLDRINTRTHRRIMVVDGRLGFMGGVGFSDEWKGRADGELEWRDTHVLVEGPIVASMQAAFHQHWVHCTGELPTQTLEFPRLASAGTLRAQLVASRAYTAAPLPVTQAVAIACSERSICITNPYCTPSRYQVKLLNKAVARGVRVRLLLPGKRNDVPITKTAGRTAYGKLLKGGVEIFEYGPAMIHSKTMVVDGVFSMIGTSNLDSRSSQINEEIDLTVYDEEFGARMEALFEKDLRHSAAYTLEDFERRGVADRILEYLVRPFKAQL